MENLHGQPLSRDYSVRRLTDRTIDELIGICKGMKADGILNPEEVFFLSDWMANNKDVIDIWPVNILFARIEKVLFDNVVDESERKDLLDIISEVTGRPNSIELINDVTHLSTSLPIDNPAPQIIFDDKSFCLTGRFFYGPREKCELEVIDRGGKIQPKPTRQTNYLVIGSFGSTDWTHSTHGRKIEYAVSSKAEGYPIALVSETHWMNFL